jgi:hypothetical protein
MAEETKNSNETEVTIPHTPGQVVTPTSNTTPQTPLNPPAPIVQPPEPAPVVAPESEPSPPTVALNTPVSEAEPAAEQPQSAPSAKDQATNPESPKGLFHAEDDGIDAEVPSKQEIEPISWTASEFVHHEKSASWYTILGGVSIVVAGGVYLLTKDIVSAAVVLVAAFTLGFYGARKPRQLDYQLDASGLSIGSKHFRYGEFKSFSVAKEGAFSSIILMPLKRFSQVTTLYFAPDNEAEIIKILSVTLPFEEHKKDAVDRLMHKIRF